MFIGFSIDVQFLAISVIGCDPTKATLSDYLLRTVLEVLNREGDNPKHLLQYFQLFVMYAGIDAAEVRIHPPVP